ncbi:hypothetical protein IRT45_09275 [Nocardia sp. BSTN01]|uniref:hypothetical protein n=1 Tax=Nocardia sp. BSTN01 TaxID=2783665 RepID=UPI00188FF6D1|nr:hypothetical protein [Nocardia sp. BSTN01]MBF4997348.1 hypothetical protein [Nocardia sp. BSTN01]
MGTPAENSRQDLHPESREVIRTAGAILAEHVRIRILRSPRPVFLYHVTRTFDELNTALAASHLPVPTTPAQRLCLHLTVAFAQHLSGGANDEINSLHALFERAAAANDEYGPLLEIGRTSPQSGEIFDFVALCGALTSEGMSRFFAPFETGGRAA